MDIFSEQKVFCKMLLSFTLLPFTLSTFSIRKLTKKRRKKTWKTVIFLLPAGQVPAKPNKQSFQETVHNVVYNHIFINNAPGLC